MANTSIGTAWIQVKPSTSGLKSAISSELNTGSSDAGSEAGGKFTTGFAAKMGAVSGITQKIFSKVTSIVSQNFNAAIERSDILNNFSNVMSNLNISSEDSQAAIDKLADKLTGLPTTLQDAAGAVQRFTTKSMDVGKSTDMFLALNNALLAGGASSEIQASALEQISQAYAKGKPDMVEWRSILTAMPAQATQLGQAFGMTADELGDALRTGKISMDDFMDKVVELNQNGVGDFKSFEEQAAAATDTIQTKLANLSGAVTQVITAALDGEDVEKPLERLKNRIIEILPQLMKGFVNAVVALLPMLVELVPPLLETVLEMLPDIIKGITQLVVKIVEMLPTIIPILVQSIPMIISALVESLLSPTTLSTIFQAAIDLFMQLVLAIPDIIVALIDALPDIITNIIDFLTDPDNIFKIIEATVELFFGIVKAVPRIIGALLEAFGNLFAKLWETLKNNFGKFVSNFGDFIKGIFKTAINGVLAFIENVVNAPIRLLNGFIGIINSAFGWIGVNIGEIGLVQLPRLATGGVVGGLGTATSDSNIVALSKGEYVIRAAAAQKIGYGNLDKLNESGELSGDRSRPIQIIINGYNKSPEELANIISRKIALKTQGVY